MFVFKSQEGYVEVLPGIQRKVLAYEEKTMLCEFLMQPNAILPAHSHPHEQTGYLVYGKLVFTINGETFTMTEGDSWAFPGGLEHQGTALEKSLIVEVFSPLREEYLPK